MWSRESRMVLEPWVSFMQSNGEVLVFDEREEQVYGIDGPAAEAFLLLQQGRSVGEVTDALLEGYDVERSVLEQDLRGALERVAAHGVCRLE